MHCTLPPLLGREVMVLTLFLTGKAVFDLRPLKGATMVDRAGVARLTAVTEAEVNIDEAIVYLSIN